MAKEKPHNASILEGESLLDKLAELEAQLRRKDFAIERLQRDKSITEHFLSKTIEDLEAANEQLKHYRQQELEEKDRTIEYQQSRLKQITDAMPSGLAFVDRELRCQTSNRPFQVWFNFRREIPQGTHIQDILSPSGYEFALPLLSQVFQGETLSFQRKTKARATGELITLDVYMVPAFGMNGEIVGAYIYARDITQLKEKEAAIKKKNQELQRYIARSLQLENFAYLASHDLKSPLNNVLNFTQLLVQSVGSKLEGQERMFLQYIEDGTHRMQRFIEDLLNYSVSTNKEIEWNGLNLHELLEEVLDELSIQLKRQQGWVCIGVLPQCIQADRMLLKQLFLNLLSNAMKFVAPGVAPRIEIGCLRGWGKYTFFIKDNGIGIEKEWQEKIFGIFKRMHLRSEYEGTGIGLSICKNAVDKHGGKIWVESSPGQGSTFYFSFSQKNKSNIQKIRTRYYW